MPARPRRSVLYMPGSNAKALAKARDPGRRRDHHRPRGFGRARLQAGGARRRRRGGAGGRFRRTRSRASASTAPHTPWGDDDLAAAIAAAPDAILLPKVDGPGAVMVAARAMREAGAPETTRLWAMMETPMAILSAGSIAATAADSGFAARSAGDGPQRSGQGDARAADAGPPALTAWLALCVAAARAHGCDIIDGVYNDINDLAGFKAECEQGRDIGLDGKTLIHPNQIEICNAIFAPTAAEIEAPRAIIAAFALPENAGKGAIQLNGRWSSCCTHRWRAERWRSPRHRSAFRRRLRRRAAWNAVARTATPPSRPAESAERRRMTQPITLSFSSAPMRRPTAS